MMQGPEILAPAGSMEALIAAVHCGADAVYLGGKALNARRGAANFDDKDLAEAVEFCHARGVKVYLTLNTLMFDSETPQVESMIETACRLGVDALIIQDPGIARSVRRMAPDMPLHGSTQMSIHNAGGARLLGRLGFSRVVLARELTREEITSISVEGGIETEVFVHGALCMCVSGQCYLSAVIGGRSGNRGMCAQPCRLPFRLEDGKNERALSLKDLSLIEHMEALRSVGAASLKIEGRMKRPEYVAAAVTACVAAKQGEAVDFEVLRRVFSRSGFTDGYFTNRVNLSMFGARTHEDVSSAAGVLGKLQKSYRKEYPRVPLSLSLVMKAGAPASLTADDGEGHQADALGEMPQAAVNRPTTEDSARQSLSKLGGTFYTICNISTEIEGGLMLPASALNALRRNAIEALTASRSQLHPVPCADPGSVPYRHSVPPAAAGPSLRIRVNHPEQITPLLVENSRFVYLPLELADTLPAFLPPEKVILQLPRFFTGDSAALTGSLRRARDRGITIAASGNLGGIDPALQAGMTVTGDFGLNVTNSASLEALEELGISDVVLSFELNCVRQNTLHTGSTVGVLGYGYLPVMLVRNCPVRASMGCTRCGRRFHTLTDRKNSRFFIDCPDSSPQIYNSVPLYIGDKKAGFRRADFFVLYFTKETPLQTDDIIRRFLSGEPPDGAFTRGLYFREVQ